MTTIHVDSIVARLFREADETVAVLDETGNVIGYFQPVSRERSTNEPPITAEDLERLRSAPAGRRLADIIEDLHGRG